MNNKRKFYFDEESYLASWRFNDKDCILSDEEKKRIVLFDESKSAALWDLFIPVKHLMYLEDKHFKLKEKIVLDFDDVISSALFFEKKITFSDFILFFWCRSSSALVAKNLFLKSWDDFFYPSDESSVLLIPNRNEVIFSFEETFFYGKGFFGVPSKHPISGQEQTHK